jgi:hypothetical protein
VAVQVHTATAELQFMLGDYHRADLVFRQVAVGPCGCAALSLQRYRRLFSVVMLLSRPYVVRERVIFDAGARREDPRRLG